VFHGRTGGVEGSKLTKRKGFRVLIDEGAGRTLRWYIMRGWRRERRKRRPHSSRPPTAMLKYLQPSHGAKKRGRKGEECIQDGGGAERLKRGVCGCGLGDSPQETHERASHTHALQRQQREAAAAAAAAS
jgi:hypothetical protein